MYFTQSGRKVVFMIPSQSQQQPICEATVFEGLVISVLLLEPLLRHGRLLDSFPLQLLGLRAG